MASFRPLLSATGGRLAGYSFVAVPLAPFAARTQHDEWSLLAIGVTAMLLVAACVMAFVNRYVYGPVNTLEAAVARIAGGDYHAAVPVTSGDELGRLAISVNVMQERIADYVGRLDGSVSQLHLVSNALTTTIDGAEPLRAAVLAAAQKLANTDEPAEIVSIGDLTTTMESALDNEASGRLEAGSTLRLQHGEHHLLLVPMLYQHRLNNVLVISDRQPLAELDERALVALANNAAIAFENARLFQQEHETVERLRQLDAMKTDFLSAARHELRTPLLAILGHIELFSAAWPKLDDASKHAMVRDIEISTRRLGDLLETIMDVSLLSGEQASVKPQAVEVGPAIESAAADVKDRYADDVVTDIAISCPPDACVLAEPKRLHQVLFALLDNAVKFSAPAGRVSVEVGVQGDSSVDICVADNGIGIGTDAVAHVFERFFQEDGSQTRAFGGLGLGLTLVDLLSKLHEADVQLESQKGKGTKVTLRWPRASSVPTASDMSTFHLVV